jgi:hypothetical protein
MKRMVVTNRAGDIIATAPYLGEGYAPRDGGPTFQDIIPLPGQRVHVVDFPDEATTVEALLRFHETHVVRVKAGKAELMMRAKKAAAPKRKRRP